MLNIIQGLVLSGLEQGLLLAIVALGLSLPFRLLNFPDLTAEGAYPLGGAVAAGLILGGAPPLVATLVAAFCAGLLGLCTAFLHIKYKVNTLLAGIILSSMIYSVNLRILEKPSLSLFGKPILFSEIHSSVTLKIVAFALVIVVLMFLLFKFLRSEVGLRFLAVGFNPKFAERQGIGATHHIFLGLFLGNLLIGFAGSLMVQNQGYMDIGMGIGIAIHALAALLIGENILGSKTLLRKVSSPILGALIYQQIQGAVIALGCPPSDLKFITGLIVLLAIIYKPERE